MTLTPEEIIRLSELRRDYSTRGLRREDMLENPVEQFRAWFEEARAAGILEPNAMTIATASFSGRVTARTVLLKAYDERGFVFFTNYGSTKASQISENPSVALLFPWIAQERQVAISGRAEKVSLAESQAYFASRPFGSRVGAWISDQSRTVSSRKILEMKFHEMVEKFRHGEVPLPDAWGGYRVVPETIEFWQGAASRIHDRFLYSRLASGGWQIDRLQP